MSENPISDALAKLKDIPDETLKAGVVVEGGDVGAAVEAKKDFGNPGGWSGSLSAAWWKAKGYELAAWIGWSGKAK